MQKRFFISCKLAVFPCFIPHLTEGGGGEGIGRYLRFFCSYSNFSTSGIEQKVFLEALYLCVYIVVHTTQYSVHMREPEWRELGKPNPPFPFA